MTGQRNRRVGVRVWRGRFPEGSEEKATCVGQKEMTWIELS